MKNKRGLGSRESIFYKKGFYLALYSCIGAIMIGAVGITYSTINSLENKTKVVDISSNKLQHTIKDDTKSYKALKNEQSNIDDKLKIKEKEDVDNKEIDSNKDEIYSNQKKININENKSSNQDKIKQNNNDIANKNCSNNLIEKNNIDDKSISNLNSREDLADPIFKSFDENDEMYWPVIGKVVMDYSTDRVIYDSTLDQFRTNDIVKIAAKKGEKVRAAADGKVKSIKNTRVDGNVVLIEHGNGWLTTYSQLDDDIIVKEGDVVLKGEIIGYVGEPTIYGVALGNHIGFKVLKEGKSIDPKLVLALK